MVGQLSQASPCVSGPPGSVSSWFGLDTSGQLSCEERTNGVRTQLHQIGQYNGLFIVVLSYFSLFFSFSQRVDSEAQFGDHSFLHLFPTHRTVGNAVVISIVVTSVTNVIVIGVLLAGVGCLDAVILATTAILATQVVVRPTVQVAVRSAGLPVAGPAHLALRRHCQFK